MQKNGMICDKVAMNIGKIIHNYFVVYHAVSLTLYYWQFIKNEVKSNTYGREKQNNGSYVWST